MKLSALRTWLRQERAREHAAWLDDPGLEWVEVSMDEPGYTARIQVPRSLREPRADVHIHGRDCDYEPLRWLVTDYIKGLSWYQWVRAKCGVEGEYPN